MKQPETPKGNKLFCALVKKHQDQGLSIREFARIINEHYTDVQRWAAGKKTLTVRAIITLCRLYDYHPHDLNPNIFPEDLDFIFTIKKRGK